MSTRSAGEELCSHCDQALGSVSVQTFGGEKLHPDCYDKWRDEALARIEPESRVLRFWGTKRGHA
jgi:hypothetical protein